MGVNCDPSTGRDMWRDMTLLTEDVIPVHPLSSTQHTAVPAEPGTALPVPYAGMEAKNPWSGFVTGPLVRKEVWKEATVSSVVRKRLMPGSPACGTVFDSGACPGASCCHSQPPLSLGGTGEGEGRDWPLSTSFGLAEPWRRKTTLCVG